jgi:hypothetical protein
MKTSKTKIHRRRRTPRINLGHVRIVREELSLRVLRTVTLAGGAREDQDENAPSAGHSMIARCNGAASGALYLIVVDDFPTIVKARHRHDNVLQSCTFTVPPGVIGVNSAGAGNSAPCVRRNQKGRAGLRGDRQMTLSILAYTRR